MAKYRLRDYIGGSSSPGGWTTATSSRRFLNVSTSYSTQSVAGQTLNFPVLFVRGRMKTTQYDTEDVRSAMKPLSLSGTSGSRDVTIEFPATENYGSVDNPRNGQIVFNFPSQMGGSVSASNYRYAVVYRSRLITMTVTVTWSGINTTYGNGSLSADVTYDWKYSVTTDSVSSTNTAWDSAGSYYNDHYYSIDLDGQTISDSNSTGVMNLAYEAVQERNAGGTSGISALVSGTFYGDYGASPSTIGPPSCNALCQREAYSYSGIYDTSNVPDPTSSVSTGNYEGGIVHVDAEYIGNNQIQYTAYSAYNGSGISGGSFYIWYKFETWSPGYTNYYWKIKVNGKAVTGRYIKINGKTYDCYDGNF